MKEGESVIRVQAYKDVRCNECDVWISAGQNFLIDIIPTGGPNKQRRIHKLHEGHWKGPVEVIVDRTRVRWGYGWSRWKHRSYESRTGRNY